MSFRVLNANHFLPLFIIQPIKISYLLIFWYFTKKYIVLISSYKNLTWRRRKNHKSWNHNKTPFFCSKKIYFSVKTTANLSHHWSEWKYCASRKITSWHLFASMRFANASPENLPTLHVEKSNTNQFVIYRWYNLRPRMKEDIFASVDTIIKLYLICSRHIALNLLHIVHRPLIFMIIRAHIWYVLAILLYICFILSIVP